MKPSMQPSYGNSFSAAYGTSQPSQPSQPSRPFITTWNSGALNKIKLPLIASPDAIIDWGDGTIEPFSVDLQVHVYADKYTIYDVSISGTVVKWSMLSFANYESIDIVAIKQWGDVGFVDFTFGFRGATQLLSIPSIDTPKVSSAVGMFAATNLYGQIINLKGWEITGNSLEDFLSNSKAVGLIALGGEVDLDAITSLSGVDSTFDSFGLQAFELDFTGQTFPLVTSLSSLMFNRDGTTVMRMPDFNPINPQVDINSMMSATGNLIADFQFPIERLKLADFQDATLARSSADMDASLMDLTSARVISWLVSSPANYGKLLIALAAVPNLARRGSIANLTLKYPASAAAARSFLKNSKRWRIFDGGQL